MAYKFSQEITPSEPIVMEFSRLASFKTDSGLLTYYMWSSCKKVVVYYEKEAAWFIQDDINICQSISDICRMAPDKLKVSELRMFESLISDKSTVLPTIISDDFLECNWSDYACDRRPIGGNVWFIDNDDSLSDDDAPPSPRKQRRFN